MYRLETCPLPHTSPGTHRELKVHRFGRPGNGPKVYLQGGVHADETPATLALVKLVERLRDPAILQHLIGEVTVVPLANPLGVSQRLYGQHLGRFDFNTRTNFNRHFPLVGAIVVERLRERTKNGVLPTVVSVREAIGATLAAWSARSEDESLKVALLRLAHDADLSIDCHSANKSVLHAFIWDNAGPRERLAVAAAAPQMTIVHRNSGMGSFEDACGEPWARVAEAFPEANLSTGCHPVCFEHAGTLQLNESAATDDASSLLRLLQAYGCLQAVDELVPPIHEADPYPIEGFCNVRANTSGILVFTCRPGEPVTDGQSIGRILDPHVEHPPTDVVTPASGLILDIIANGYVGFGDVIATICSRNAVANEPPFDA